MERVRYLVSMAGPDVSIVQGDEENVSADAAARLFDAGFAEPANGTGGDAVDLREVPVSKGRLRAALAEVEDVDLIRTMMESDDRANARAEYEARIAELETEG